MCIAPNVHVLNSIFKLDFGTSNKSVTIHFLCKVTHRKWIVISLSEDYIKQFLKI